MVDPSSPPEHTDDAAGRLLRAATDRYGRTALSWIAEPLQGSGLVLDLCCGSGALAGELRPGRWFGVDAGSGRRRPRAVGQPTAIPLQTSSVDAIALLLALPRLDHVDDVFAEIRRVLRPAGTMVLLVPSAAVRSIAEFRFSRVTTPLHRTGWPNRSALDQAGWLIAAADFALLGDDRVTFSLPLPDAVAALALVEELPRAGLWPAGGDRQVQQLTERAGPGVALPVPLRRLVARR